jgi:hypothetical protein
VEAKAISWAYAPVEAFDFFEVLHIALDEDFPEGTFRLELPGVVFRTRQPVRTCIGTSENVPSTHSGE